MSNLDSYRKHHNVAPDKPYLPETENKQLKILIKRLESLRKIAVKVKATSIIDEIDKINPVTEYRVKNIETALFDFLNNQKQVTPLFEIKNIRKARNVPYYLDNDKDEIG